MEMRSGSVYAPPEDKVQRYCHQNRHHVLVDKETLDGGVICSICTKFYCASDLRRSYQTTQADCPPYWRCPCCCGNCKSSRCPPHTVGDTMPTGGNTNNDVDICVISSDSDDDSGLEEVFDENDGNDKEALDLAVEMIAMKMKEEESQATIFALQATLAKVESQKLELEKERELLRKQLERKELDKRIIANMFGALSKCLQVFGPLLDENEARSILDKIKQVITVSASKKADTEDSDAEPEEEKQVFYQVVEVLGSLVKILKASFLPCIDELSRDLMPMLAKDKTVDERRKAVRVFVDVADECLPEAEYHSVFAFWFSYCDTYLPYLLEACIDDDPKIRQFAAYGVGLCAEHGGFVTKPLIGDALSRLTDVILDPKALHADNVMAYDNAVSALGKLLHFHRDSIDSAALIIPVWLNCLPIKVDDIEAKAVHELLTLMVERSDAQLLGPNNEYLPQVFSIFAEILCAGKDVASDQTICRIMKLLRQFQQTLPPATLASILSALQPHQKMKLQSILPS